MRDGPNELKAAARTSALSLLFAQFKNILIVILIIATVLSAFTGHAVESVAIAVIVLFAVLLGFVQEYRAEHAIEALRRMTAPTASVLRDGRPVELPAREVVAGDIVFLQTGNKVPADARLIEAVNLRAEESPLTGESVPAEKHVQPLDDAALGVGDRQNCVWSGTVVVYGRGKAVVTSTGMNTEFGRITGSLSAVKTPRTPLQENLDRVGKALAMAALVIVAVIVALGVWRGQPILDMFIFGIALAVAVVPEALPAVVTISLALGVQRMARRNALVRRLPVVETLGSTSVICSDKTGTLTKDEMTVRELFAGKDGEEALLRAAWLCSDATAEETDGRWDIKGDPTEAALVIAAMKAGLKRSELERAYPRVDEIPFSSETKRMTTVHENAGARVAFTKGAPEIILGLCSEPDGPGRAALIARAQEMASRALRVLAVAQKNAPAKGAEADGMTFLGLVGMIDPPRPEARGAVATCEAAGIRAVMITGDHPLTAQAIARELGILKKGRAVTGAELEAMSTEALEREAPGIDVYARVSPEHKLRIVAALQKKGQVVAMTGDGVNDAPALKKADIGIAMGITGTDVTKEVAAMTLADDNFATIVAAVEEGRHIFENVKKYLMYLLSSNTGEIGLMTAAMLLGLPMPLTAVQILYVNLATDGLPALALAVDPPDRGLMNRKPRDPKTGIFTKPVVTLILAGGVWSALVNLGMFAWSLSSGSGVSHAMTLTFVTLILIEFFKAYNYRSDHRSVFRRPFANRWLNRAILWELALLLAVVYVPWMQKPFGTVALTPQDWAVAGAAAASIVPVLEAVKWRLRRGR